jgi:hypothetical protein
MERRIAKTLVQLAAPRAGNEVRKLVRGLARIAGIHRIVPMTKIPRLLSVDYDPNVIQPNTLVQYIRRGWAGARLV